MKTKHHLTEYLSRLINQTLVQVTGGLGLFLTIFSELIFPGMIIKWIFYLILLTIGLLIGSYKVFVDLVKESTDEHNKLLQQLELLNSKLKEVEEKRPRVNVQLLDNAGHSTQRLTFALAPLPSEPAFDEEVAKKRNKLLEERQKRKIEINPDLAFIMDGLGKPNPNYERDVEEYLIAYREYLVEKY